MSTPSPPTITEMLLAWREGDDAAFDAIVPVVYDELHRLAHRCMRGEAAGHVLQTTALVNEAYLHLVDARKVAWHDRAHFFAICAKLMRRVLVHDARARHARKRGGGLLHVSLEESTLYAPAPDANLLRLDDALTALEAFDARKARVVELKFFGGLSLDEAAEVLKVSAATVWRDWDLAKAWLHREMAEAEKR
jgi:RNA polymerase sigma factor (TIGR02999 family)